MTLTYLVRTGTVDWPSIAFVSGFFVIRFRLSDVESSVHPGGRRVMSVCLITGETNSDLLVKVVSASARFLAVKFCFSLCN